MLESPARPAQAPEETATETAYVGEWTSIGRAVMIEREGRRSLLPLRPTQIGGYAWGRGGTLPREVARAILIDVTENPMLAERLCRRLTWDVISELPENGFRLTLAEVLGWIAAQADDPS